LALGLAAVLLFISFNWLYKVIFVRLTIVEGAYPTAQAWKIDQRSAYFENFEKIEIVTEAENLQAFSGVAFPSLYPVQPWCNRHRNYRQ
jgi:hypothetical protein